MVRTDVASILWLYCAMTIIAIANAATNTASKKTYGDIAMKLEISYQNISSNLNNWDRDYAIMFYAPWCKYCKQLYASWEVIENLVTKSNKYLTTGTFNCELNKKNTEICEQFGIDRYPSVYYLGYGSFYQSHPSKIMKTFPANTKNRIVRYNADIYPEALYDWITMLSTLSNLQRRWRDAKLALSSLLTGKPIQSSSENILQEKVKSLEKKVDQYAEMLEKFKADELFDSLEDNGDPYPLLASLEPDEQNLPFRMCVADMVAEYCKYHNEEAHCGIADDCLDKSMEPKTCRPDKCPFKSRGCVVASLCLDTSVVKQYQEALVTAT